MSKRSTYRLAPVAWTVITIEVLLVAMFVGLWWMLDRHEPSFRLERPNLLPYFPALALLAVVYLLDLYRRTRALARFADDRTRERLVSGLSNKRSAARFLLVRHGLSFILIAAAGPQFGSRMEEVKAEGIDVIVALDVSNSMECQDIRPSRMEASRRALAQLVDRLHGDRLGIVIFAGEAYVQLPLTADRSAAKLFINTIGPHMVPTQGTAIGRAIELAERGFDTNSSAGRAIIVITDGEDHEDDAEGAARAAAGKGTTVHTIGMGTVKGGPIPIRRGNSVQGYRKDRQGNTVVSRLDEAMLQRIAEAGTGIYLRANERSAGIDVVMEELRGLDTAETGSFKFTGHKDHFQYPLAAGMLLVLAGMLLGERSRRNEHLGTFAA